MYALTGLLIQTRTIEKKPENSQKRGSGGRKPGSKNKWFARARSEERAGVVGDHRVSSQCFTESAVSTAASGVKSDVFSWSQPREQVWKWSAHDLPHGFKSRLLEVRRGNADRASKFLSKQERKENMNYPSIFMCRVGHSLAGCKDCNFLSCGACRWELTHCRCCSRMVHCRFLSFIAFEIVSPCFSLAMSMRRRGLTASARFACGRTASCLGS